MRHSKPPRIALVYDHLTTPYGGAEVVIQSLHQLYPNAPLFTSVWNSLATPWTQNIQVIPSFLQRIPGAQSHHRWLAPLLPFAFESHNLDEYDIVISISAGESKGVLTKPHQLHVCYILTPPRYLYSHANEYKKNHIQARLPGADAVLDYLRWWDRAAALRPNAYLAISKLVAQRTQKEYGRPIEAIVPPPIPTLPQSTSDYSGKLVCSSRLVAYKKIDLAIQACVNLKIPLTILGDGPERGKLEELAQGSSLITFLGSVSNSHKAEILSHAKGFLMPGLEDFGIAALEAQSYGIPIIVHTESGVLDCASPDGVIKITSETVKEVEQAIQKLNNHKWNPQHISKNMKKYDRTNFARIFGAQIEDLWKKHVINT